MQLNVSRVLVIAAALTSAPSHALELYVTPAGASGANCMGTPCSLVGARDKARVLLGSGINEDIIINLRAGTYYLPEPLKLGNLDSGQNGRQVIYQAYPGERVVISGGIVINPASWVMDATQGGWVTDVSSIVNGENTPGFRQIYVNNKRAVRARTPNEGFLTAVETIPFTVANSDLGLIQPLDISQAEIVYSSHWMHVRGRISSFSNGATQSVVNFKAPESASSTFNCKNNAWQNNSPYFFENSLSMLDHPGEWFLDRTAPAKLYYKPRVGEVMGTTEVIVPRSMKLIEAVGAEGAPITNITIRGLEFAHSNWDDPTKYGYVDAPQSSVQMETTRPAFVQCQCVGPTCQPAARILVPASVEFRHASNITIENNQFYGLGAHGILMSGILTNYSIRNNTFKDVAAGGIYDVSKGLGDDTVSSKSTGGEIYWNRVEEIGKDYTGAVGILATTPNGIRICKNEVRDTPYAGISLGWKWSFVDVGANDNRVANNWIYRVMKHHDDGAGIYTLGRMDNTVFTNNFISEINRSSTSDGYPVVAIYLDQGSQAKTISNNVAALLGPNVEAFSAKNKPINSNSFAGNFYKGVIGKVAPSPDIYTIPGNSCSDPNYCNKYDASNQQIGPTQAWPSAAVAIMNQAGRRAIDVSACEGN